MKRNCDTKGFIPKVRNISNKTIVELLILEFLKKKQNQFCVKFAAFQS